MKLILQRKKIDSTSEKEANTTLKRKKDPINFGERSWYDFNKNKILEK
jgi:hypothetical protein